MLAPALTISGVVILSPGRFGQTPAVTGLMPLNALSGPTGTPEHPLGRSADGVCQDGNAAPPLAHTSLPLGVHSSLDQGDQWQMTIEPRTQRLHLGGELP
jgi:hypothetical protein